MQTITLNIIPEVYETRFRMRRIYIMARHIMLLLIIYMLVLGTILLAARYVLQREFVRIVNETSLVTADNRALERNVEKLNNYVRGVLAVEKKYVPWTPLLIDINKAIPDGVTLNVIYLSSENVISLSGTANTRSDLLSLKDSLEAMDSIDKVELPIADLVTAKNVPFKVDFKIDVDKLKKADL